MTTKKRSVARSKTSSKRSNRESKMTPMGKSIVRGLEEAAAYMRGEIQLRTTCHSRARSC
jgi:hypothetical protein